MNGRHVVACPPELSTMPSQWRANLGKRDWCHVGWEERLENLVSNQLRKFKLSPFQKIEKLKFPALALPQGENRHCMLSILGGEKLCLSQWKERIAWSSSSRDGVALRKSPLKCTWANSLAFPGICLAKTCSPAFFSNCHIPTPTFFILHLVKHKCKTEYHSPNFWT